jgi:hypothetical protein
MEKRIAEVMKEFNESNSKGHDNDDRYNLLHEQFPELQQLTDAMTNDLNNATNKYKAALHSYHATVQTYNYLRHIKADQPVPIAQRIKNRVQLPNDHPESENISETTTDAINDIYRTTERTILNLVRKCYHKHITCAETRSENQREQIKVVFREWCDSLADTLPILKEEEVIECLALQHVTTIDTHFQYTTTLRDKRKEAKKEQSDEMKKLKLEKQATALEDIRKLEQHEDREVIKTAVDLKLKAIHQQQASAINKQKQKKEKEKRAKEKKDKENKEKKEREKENKEKEKKKATQKKATEKKRQGNGTKGKGKGKGKRGKKDKRT